MFRPLLLAAAGLALLAPAGLALLAPVARARTVVVTAAQNGRAVTLVAGDTLVVRLTSQSNGLGVTEWSVVYNPEGALRLSSDPHYLYPMHPHGILVIGMGDPIPQEFHFTVPQSKENFTKGAWLLFLSMSPFDPSVKYAKTWKIKYTIKATQ